jgi:hypothetical protein
LCVHLGGVLALRSLGVGLLLDRPEHHGHIAAILLGHGFHGTQISGVLSNAFQQTAPGIRPGLLATTEHDHDLDLVPTLQETLDVTEFGLVVMRVNLEAEAHLAQHGVGLVPAGFARLHVSLVLELSVVHQLGYGRTSVRRYLNEIEVRILGKPKRHRRSYNAHLLPTGADETNFGHSDAVIDARFSDGHAP